MILTSKEMMHGTQSTYPSLKNWVGEGMPVIRQNPWLFDKDKVLKWLKAHKPERADHLEKYLKMMEK